MKLFVAGISHKTAPVSVRDRVAINPENLKDRLDILKSNDLIKECLLLSTCNRTELYGLISRNCNIDKASVTAYNSLYPGIDIPLNQHMYCYTGEDAVRHLFRVSAGLDSLALGEPQIFGQLKDAYRAANRCKSTGPVLNRLIHKTFSVTKKIRTDTEIGEGTISISFAAVEMAQKIFGLLHPLRVMIIGAGETGTLTADHFKKRGVTKFLIANRTYERAEKLALAMQGSAIRFNMIYNYLNQVDIVVTCVGADDLIILKKPVEQAMKERKNRPLFFIDLGAPRDVDPGTKDIYNVFAYNIDDLRDVVESNLARRKSAAADAEKIIGEEVGEFFEWFSAVGVIPAIRQIQEYCEDIRKKEFEANKSKLNGSDVEQVDLLTRSIVKKILKTPILRLKENATTKDGPAHADAVQRLFNTKRIPPKGHSS